MHCPKRYFVLLSLSVAISLLTVSCAETKVSQCEKIIQVANQAVNQAKSFTNDGNKASDPKAMLQAADAMEKASQKMKAVDIKDQKLKSYQSSFTVMYRDMGKATRDYVAAFEKKDRSAAVIAVTNLQQATNPEKQLVTDINTYCSGK